MSRYLIARIEDSPNITLRTSLTCPAHALCPAIAVQHDHTMVECNTETKLCEAVKPEDIQCGGRANRHLCPDGFECADTEASHVDGPGVCEALSGAE